MQKVIKKKIGSEVHSFIVEAKNLHQLIMEERKLSFPNIDKCGLCGSDNLYFNARISGEDNFEYTEIKCAKCSGVATFGKMKKQPDVYFLRKDKTSGKIEWKNPPKKEENK